MAYGSGKPSWSRGGGDAEEGGLNRRSNAGSGNNAGGSYQRGEGAGYNNYQPPQLTGGYAEQQTQVVEDTMRTHIQVRFTFGVYFNVCECPIRFS